MLNEKDSKQLHETDTQSHPTNEQESEQSKSDELQNDADKKGPKPKIDWDNITVIV